MPIAWYFAVPSGIIVVVSVPLYIIMLASHHKYRHKAPFDSSFFKITFHCGMYDLLHLFNDWVLGMLFYVGLYDFMLEHANIFAKQFSLVWWYSAWAQKMGVLFLAIDRLMSMWFSKTLTARQVKILIAINYIFPAFLTAPQAFVDFGYKTFNGSHGLLVYWENPNYQWMYFFFCLFYCGGTSLVCGVSYGLTFYKVYQHQKRSTTRAGAKNARTEAKLAFAGFVLFFMTFCCGIFCWSLVTFEMDFNIQLFMLGLLQVVFDSYCCINPYLILACSSKAMSHFKALLFNKPPEIYETTKGTKSAISVSVRPSGAAKPPANTVTPMPGQIDAE